MSLQSEIRRLLKVKFTSPNGKLAAVFVTNKNNPCNYDCVLCSLCDLSSHNLVSHASGRKHLQNLDLLDVETSSERGKAPFADSHRTMRCRSPNIRTDTASKSKVSKLQASIDDIRNNAILGVEFVLEVHSDRESTFHYCALCRRKFYETTDVVNHLTSYGHRLDYLKHQFPNVFNDVNYLLELVSNKIENRYGRHKLIMLEQEDFSKNKDKFTRIATLQCINKDIGCDELLQVNAEKGSDDDEPTVCLDTISISSGSSSNDKSRTKERSCSPGVSDRDRSDKLEAFRVRMTSVRNELMKTYQPYIANPCSYPGYYEMWCEFWNTRYKELSKDGKHKKYDWESEWASEWKKLINGIITKDIQSKCEEIKNELGVTDRDLSEIEKRVIEPPEVVIQYDEPSTTQTTRRSPQMSRKRSRSPDTSDHPNRVCSNSSSSAERYDKSQQQGDTVASNKTPLRMEQLIEKHKQSGDFYISWRELLTVFDIEANNKNSKQNQKSPAPVQMIDAPIDRSEKRDTHQETAAIQKDPLEPIQPVTVLSVLGILTALENILGSLGARLIYLLQTAVAMDKVDANSSNNLLDDTENSILFDTIKEKLKGLMAANLVDPHLRNLVRTAIRHMTELVDQSNEKKKKNYVQPSLTQFCENVPFQSQRCNYAEPSFPSVSTQCVPLQPNHRVHTIVSHPPVANEFHNRADKQHPLTQYTENGPLQPNHGVHTIPSHPPAAGEFLNRAGRQQHPLTQYTESGPLQPNHLVYTMTHPPAANEFHNRADKQHPLTQYTQSVPLQPNHRLHTIPSHPPAANEFHNLAEKQTPSAQYTECVPLQPNHLVYNLSTFPPAANEFDKRSERQPPLTQHSTPKRPQNVSLAKPNTNEFGQHAENATFTLNDSEIKILMAKFSQLSEKDKSNFTTFMGRLKTSDPKRLMRLKKDFRENVTMRTSPDPNRDDELYCPGEVFYTDVSTEENVSQEASETSIAYRVAKRNPSVKIKRMCKEATKHFD